MLTLPAIYAVRRHFPKAKITVLASEYTQPLLIHHPAIDAIIFDYDLKKYNFDLSINFYNRFKDTWATFTAGIPYRLGDSSRILTGWMNNLRVFRHWEDITKHEISFNLELLSPLGIIEPPQKPQLSIDPKALDNVNTILGQNGINKGDHLAGIHIGSATSKSWSIEGFAKTANWLAQEKGHKILVLGSKAEIKRAEKISNLINRPFINLVGRLSLPELVATISLLNFYLGMDTGPSHIAAALNIPLVMLFLNKQALPTRWGPFNVRHLTVSKQREEKDSSINRVIAACKIILAGGGVTTPKDAFPYWLEQARGL